MENKQLCTVNNERFREKYHVMAKGGWLNDPNGFCFFKGNYHIFYQYHPYSSDWGPMHWGHAISKDLVHWETLPIALYPGNEFDKDGCFSGSAIVKENQLYLIYTGHNYYDENNPENFWQTQNIAVSKDGIHFEKYPGNPVIATPPDDNSIHFRDPKVWQENDQYYMIVGSQNKEEVGRALLYQSIDLIHWSIKGEISKAISSHSEGFMWECPDFFKLNDQYVLISSPQGIESKTEKYLNLFQTGYFIGEMDYENTNFSRNEFLELDYGHDFYAAQTMLAPDGRRILIGWMSMWESEMKEKEDGWAGALTIARELILTADKKLRMCPVAEMKKLRHKQVLKKQLTLSACYVVNDLKPQQEINVTVDLVSYCGKEVAFLLLNQQQETVLKLSYSRNEEKLTMFRPGKDCYRYAHLPKANQLSLTLYLDTSSAEWFINDGSKVFTERFYEESTLRFAINTDSIVTTSLEVYNLDTDVIRY
ncbi:glycoside hydrolase family 32 protein [Vagococcus entomophilus]|uniref:Sucrose-6-phosphate hydrolase n=1 Tax=Vagococcus entomophilus TaxID=1160095 RepID=A0A430AK63_9ENTE|nr:sucrose-6-phosphate hydrolase [Vagococcus entomophilus]RSU08307.1 sucrose-6-phosphate hydrolase [Vagococcus entomophilus]